MTPLPMGEAEYRGLARVARELDLFTPFKGADLDRILGHLRLFGVGQGETIFKTGDPPEALFIVYEGQVKIAFSQGWLWLFRKRTTLGPGQLFGEMALLDNAPRSATAIAETPVKLFTFLRDDFQTLVKENPVFASEMRQIASLRRFQARH
jgi:CRP-like cAMP-binding protein